MERRKPTTRNFEVTWNLRKVSPLRKASFDSYQPAYSRDDGSRGISTGLAATIVDDKLRLSTFPHSCHYTGAGCFRGQVEWTPGEVKLEESVPAGACISYAVGFDGKLTIGIGTELRAYEQKDDGRVIAGARMTVPILDAVGAVDGGAALQGRDGRLWLARWDAAVPTVNHVPGVVGRVRTMSLPTNGVRYVYTDSAMYAVDPDTLEVRWKIDGEVWSAMSQDVPQRHFVLTIERGATPRVLLRLVDAKGRELDKVVVYKGADLIEAHLERVSVPVSRDLREALFLVFVATG